MVRKTDPPKTRQNLKHWGWGWRDLVYSREGFLEEGVDHEDSAKNSHSGKTFAGA